MRGERDFARARRHSTIVRGLKGILPICAIAIVVVFGASTLLSFNPIEEVSIDSAGLKDGKLVMEKPKMAGFDKNNRPYDVTASQAIQDLTRPGIVELKAIDARLPMDATSFAEIDAKTGFYDTNKETLLLKDDVVIKGARGMDILLKDANIDMKSGSMKSDNPVKVTSDDANISADSVQVKENGKRIVFKNRVKMTITRPVARGTETSQ